MPINLDEDINNSDWTKTEWDILDVETREDLAGVIERSGLTVEQFSGLPVVRHNKDVVRGIMSDGAIEKAAPGAERARARGLVPQTGDWDRPGRWVSSEQAGQPQQEGARQPGKPQEGFQTMEPELLVHNIGYSMIEGMDEDEIRVKASDIANHGLSTESGLRNELTETLEENLGQEPSIYSYPLDTWMLGPGSITGKQLLATMFIIPGREVGGKSKARDFNAAHEHIHRDEPMEFNELSKWRERHERAFGQDIGQLENPEILTTVDIPPGNVVGGFMVANRLGVGVDDKVQKSKVLEVVKQLRDQKVQAGVVKAKPTMFVHVIGAHDAAMEKAAGGRVEKNGLAGTQGLGQRSGSPSGDVLVTQDEAQGYESALRGARPAAEGIMNKTLDGLIGEIKRRWLK